MLEDVKKILISDYTYDLPDENIASYPLEKRDESKLLVYQHDVIFDTIFKELHDFIPENSLLISNETKVIAARLLFKTKTDANIEVFCLEPFLPAEINQSLQTTKTVQWKCMVGRSKKWHEEEILSVDLEYENVLFSLTVKKVRQEKNAWIIEFSWTNSTINFAQVLSLAGHIPLPPYLNRTDEESDKERYQTVYAKQEGSVAAPTAGLHFTNEVISNLKKINTDFTSLTLHVGAGTFLPVKSETIADHDMHEEIFEVSVETLKKIQQTQNKIIAVGTTSLRTLESLYWAAVKLTIDEKSNLLDCHVSQWEPYEIHTHLNRQDALEVLLDFAEKNNLTHICGKTGILIAPGYDIKMADGIITNFHQPNSTLLLLISAIVGEKWKSIYHHALENNYRFLSFGDSSLLMKKGIDK